MSLRYRLNSYLKDRAGAARDRARATRESLTHDFGDRAHYQFIRYALYVKLEEWIKARFPASGPAPRVVEFGGSNGIIPTFFPRAEYEVAPNYPEVDVQDLRGYPDATYDVAILDEVLEHVEDPIRSVAEMLRVLKPGGVCICNTPFLVQIHQSPVDYWRFTDLGLRTLFRGFGDVEVHGWGNRFTIATTARFGWLPASGTKKILRVALWNEPDWPIMYMTIATKAGGGGGAVAP